MRSLHRRAVLKSVSLVTITAAGLSLAPHAAQAVLLGPPPEGDARDDALVDKAQIG